MKLFVGFDFNKPSPDVDKVLAHLLSLKSNKAQVPADPCMCHMQVLVCAVCMLLPQQEKECDDKVLLEFLSKAKESKEKVGGLANSLVPVSESWLRTRIQSCKFILQYDWLKCHL